MLDSEATSSVPWVKPFHMQCHLCRDFFNDVHLFLHHQQFCSQPRPQMSGPHPSFNPSALTLAKEADPLGVAADYSCDRCDKRFTVPARLARHYRIHTGEKPFACEVCGKSFSVKENLAVHKRIHTKERPYACDVCGKSFEHSGKLHRHIRIHTGERPHKCDICGKSFIQSGQLVIHRRTHTGEKPYVCTVCSKGFTCSKQLKVHMRTHTGEKPYKCNICGKAFGYNHVLKLHQVSHFGEKLYKCTLCKETFSSKKKLETHIRSHDDPSDDSNDPPTRPPMASFSYAPSQSHSISCIPIEELKNKFHRIGAEQKPWHQVQIKPLDPVTAQSYWNESSHRSHHMVKSEVEVKHEEVNDGEVVIVKELTPDHDKLKMSDSKLPLRKRKIPHFN